MFIIMVTTDLHRDHKTPVQRFFIATKAHQALEYASRFLPDITPAGKGERIWIMIESPCVNPECLCRYQCLLNGTE